jgi:S-adenosylmethionine:diacylglycerol 3-amino-3-carboxypropyl transferase
MPRRSTFYRYNHESGCVEEIKYRSSANTRAKWPIHSDVAGVNPLQRNEAEKVCRDLGVPTKYDRQGRAVWESPSHRKRHCEALGYFDKNSYGTSQEARQNPNGRDYD